jgi:hypothetical protein
MQQWTIPTDKNKKIKLVYLDKEFWLSGRENNEYV